MQRATETQTHKRKHSQQAQATTNSDEVEVDPLFCGEPGNHLRLRPQRHHAQYNSRQKRYHLVGHLEGIIQYDGNTFTNMTNKEGLRRFRVFSLLEDTGGNIWFGTIGAGLYRYDGRYFTNFTTEDGLVNNKIGSIMEAENGVIWIGTMAGISRYDGTTFSSFTIQGGANNNDVNSIVETTQENYGLALEAMLLPMMEIHLTK